MAQRLKEKEELFRNRFAGSGIVFGELVFYDAVESTMDSAFALLSKFPKSIANRSLVIAETQSCGRGRFERKWVSSRDDLQFSLILTEHDFRIPYSMLASYAVYVTFRSYTPNIALKWVNDVLWENGKKVAGVLTEETESAAVIGIGVNLNSRDFSADLSEKATSYFIETGEKIDRDRFFETLVRELFFLVEDAHNGGLGRILHRWESASSMKGRAVVVETGERVYRGTVCGIHRTTGALIVECGKKRVELYEGSLRFEKERTSDGVKRLLRPHLLH
jgi:BirA family biotin operon repressor/biotin-[acetyl-CoA-carboxylase] ligase